MRIESGESFEKIFYKTSDTYAFEVNIDNMPYHELWLSIADSSTFSTIFFSSGEVSYLEAGGARDGGPYFQYSEGDTINLKFSSVNGRSSFFVNDTLCRITDPTGLQDAPEMFGQLSVFNLSSNQLEFDFSCYGEEAPIGFSNPFTNDGENFSGYIVNSGTDTLHLYSGYSENNINFSIPSSILAGQSGVFSFSGEDFTENQTLTISFETSAGTLSNDFILNSNVVDGNIDFLNVFSSEIFLNDIKEYSVYGYSSSEISEDIGLSRTDSGSKLINLWGSGEGIGSFSGDIVGSGYLYGTSITGLIGGSGHQVPATGDGRIFAWATGIIEHYYFVTVVGIEDGELYTGIIEGGPIYGEVLDGSGHYVFDFMVTGTPDFSVGPTVNSSPTGIYTGHYYSLEIITSYRTVVGTGELTNGLSSFIFTEPNIFNLVDVQIGTFAEGFEDYESFYDNGWYLISDYIKATNRSGNFSYDLRVIQFQDREDSVPSYWAESEENKIFRVETEVYSEDVFEFYIYTPFETYIDTFSG